MGGWLLHQGLAFAPLNVCQRRSPGGFYPLSMAVKLLHHQVLPLQNHSNSDVVSIDCNVKLAPNEEMNLHLHGHLWMKSLKAVSLPKAALTLPSEGHQACVGCTSWSPGWCGHPTSCTPTSSWEMGSQTALFVTAVWPHSLHCPPHWMHPTAALA